MKRILYLFSAFMLMVVTACAKKVKLTIDGIASPSQTSLYMIINEDIENAQALPITDGRFSVTVEVEPDAFVRLHDYKEWPERGVFVLIPDSRHIDVDWRDGSIKGSPMSNRLREAINEARKHSPEGFHIDVFSDNPEAWKDARESERSMREQMLQEQIKSIEKVIRDNNNNIIPAWIVYCYQSLLEGPYRQIIDKNKKHKWAKHPIIKKSGVLNKKE